MTTMEKVKHLEQYIAINGAPEDPVMNLVLDKLMQRERQRASALRTRLHEQFTAFEAAHGLETPVFYSRYEKGEMGDDMDFIEWAATWEMLLNLEKKTSLLEARPVA